METKNNNWIVIVISTLATVFLVYGFLFGTLVPYLQYRALKASLKESSIQDMSPFLKNDFIYEPKTNAQHLIRYSVFDFISNTIDEKNYTQLSPALDFVIAKMEEYIQLHPHFSNYQLKLARGYHKKWELGGDKSWLIKEEEVYKNALAFNPGRQEILYLYAVCLADQGKLKEAGSMLDAVATSTPSLPDTHYFKGILLSEYMHDARGGLTELNTSINQGFDPNPRFTRGLYYKFLGYFYKQRDVNAVVSVLTTLIKVEPQQTGTYLAILNDIKANRVLPIIDLK